MENIYSNYKCKSCKKEFVILTAEAGDTLRQGKYLSCPHCGSRNIIKTNSTDNFKECMSHTAYKKERGSFRQVRDG